MTKAASAAATELAAAGVGGADQDEVARAAGTALLGTGASTPPVSPAAPTSGSRCPWPRIPRSPGPGGGRGAGGRAALRR
ncbi:hypothetical protein B0I33_101411 [Prauserella shujinwangii]|uniref:Uncharacterized protein n=1 Tax=Prauserella shujinwangii TaxID=1453103 RepID=A0A2T0M3E0_9PSEU|nr:hypothetical protein [Prauserella shujinwangii]PRX51258.1 hypothetical protein B0I33_101411 [Prauserella shujinwangii]